MVEVSGTFSTDNATALRKAALGGHGIAYVPRGLVYHDFRNGALVDVFPEQVSKTWYLRSLSIHAPTAKQSAFVD